MSKRIRSTLIIISGIIFSIPALMHAATATELQQQINSHTNQIKQLEDEINRYQTELTKTSAEAKNLQSAVQTLDLNAKKLGADLQVTSNKIERNNLTIQELSLQIKDKQQKIEDAHDALASTLRVINEADSHSLIENMLSDSDLSNFWSDVDSIGQFQSKVQDNLAELKTLQASLLENKLLTEQKKKELLGLKGQLADQKTVIDVNKTEKTKLLTQTKSQETAYKQLIADKKAKKDAFEKELSQIESQLKTAINPGSIPNAQTGVLAWPLTKHVITQNFGYTEFALAHSALYSSQGHNAIDLAAAVGTPVMSALSGTVLGTGNTDISCPGASYGNWVMVKHNNGLSTLYAHLSLIKVSAGQQVSTGDIIGYSGLTGYTTGPHLHFGVYASDGVSVQKYNFKSCSGASVTMPITTKRGAVLNPMNYL